MIIEPTDNDWMTRALTLAKQAFDLGEVPVGAVLVQGQELMAEAFNHPIGLCDATAHAEILALRAASQRLHNYRLVDTTLYVTLEPCMMCVGALIHARIKRVVFGALEPKAGALVSQMQLAQAPHLNHRLEVLGGVCADEASALMQAFFKQRRLAQKALKQNPSV
jgi:tRNA(adenine34) deaminase